MRIIKISRHDKIFLLSLKLMSKPVAIFKADLLHLDVILQAFAFTLPFIVSGPQWLTGTLVNCLLFLSAARLSERNRILLAVMPGIGALLHGAVFGPFTPFLIYFLPVIWTGNYLLTSVFSRMKNHGYFTRVVASSMVKFGLLVFFAYIFYGLKIVPKMFLSSMGMIQLVTALTGGLLSYFVIRLVNNKYG